MAENKIDKAVFQRLGNTQTFACVFYKDDKVVGNFLDCLGVFISDINEWLGKKYPGITIEIKDDIS